MKFTVVTLFPDLIEAFRRTGLVGQAVDKSALEITTLNPRDFATDVHRTVDDRAFGGGDGMVMKAEPLRAAIESLRARGPCRVAVLSPQGKRWSQSLARHQAEVGGHVVLVCGRYAGIDQRFSALADEEISIGDYILNGGEVAACAIIESIARLRPGVLGNAVSAAQDSFSTGLLECPQFTRPREYEGMKVPSPLLSGHHQKIRHFEAAVSLVRTHLLRPDLVPEKCRLESEIAQLESLEDSELRALGMTRAQLSELKGR